MLGDMREKKRETDEIKERGWVRQLFVSDRDNISQLLLGSVKREHLSPTQDIAFQLMRLSQPCRLVIHIKTIVLMLKQILTEILVQNKICFLFKKSCKPAQETNSLLVLIDLVPITHSNEL